MDARYDSRDNLTLANLITLARILLTPLFVIFLIHGQYPRALIVFLLAGVSDLADGLIARTWQQKSRLGSYLDPLADKTLMSASFITLAIYHQIPSWLTVMVISRDVVLVLGVLLFRLTDQPLVIRPTRVGKWTTTLQAATVLLVLVAKIWPLPPLVLLGFFWATGALTAVSGVHYIYRELSRTGSPPPGEDQGEAGRG